VPIRQPIRADLSHDGLAIDRVALGAALARLPKDAPIVALIHGYSFQPDLPGQCPHRHIFSLMPEIRDGKSISWPGHLALNGVEGLAITCGWRARGSLWTAHGKARAAGLALAQLAEVLRALDPDRRLDVVAHSMGARVALSALEQAEPGDFGRLILLAGAESRAQALRAMASPAGTEVQVINVTTRENDLFDAGFEWLVHGGRQVSIGQGLSHCLGQASPANWCDLWLDRPQVLSGLERLGYPLPSPPRRICHWSPYLRPGIFQLYRALLKGELHPDDLPRIAPAPRWSLLVRPWLSTSVDNLALKAHGAA
jgi:pimeloyl-ACP methyl ester carboxylesterase